MKYVLFTVALCGIVPLAIVCRLSRKLLAGLMTVMFLAVLAWDSSALNFFSFEFYRGTSRGLEISVVYLLALAALLCVWLYGRFVRPFPDLGSWLYLVYFVICVISVRQAVSFDVSNVWFDGGVVDLVTANGTILAWCEVWKMAMMALVFYAVYTYLQFSQDPMPIIKGLGLALIFCFMIVVKEHFVGCSQAKGPFNHQNSLAMFALLITPIYLSAFLNCVKGPLWLFLTVAFVCGSGSLFRTYSRGAMAIYPLVSGFSAFLSFVRNFRLDMVRRLAPIAVVGFLGMLLLIPKIVNRFESASEQSAGNRVKLARIALRMVFDKPWTGVGVNNWGTHMDLDGEYVQGEMKENSIVETIYLLVAAECGIPGLLALLAWFGYYWIVCFRLVKRLAGSKWFFLPTGILAGLSGCYIQSALEWVMKQQVNFMLMMVLFAMIAWMNRNWKTLRLERQ